MNNKRTLMISTIPFGEHKVMYLPSNRGKEKRYKNFVLFVKNKGNFNDERPKTYDEFFDAATPYISLRFKNKTSINRLIGMLEHFRDTEYGKTDEEILNICEK